MLHHCEGPVLHFTEMIDRKKEKLSHGDEMVSYHEMKCRIDPLAKLDCFCTQKKFNVFTFSQAQTGLRGGPIQALHLLLAYNLFSTTEMTNVQAPLAPRFESMPGFSRRVCLPSPERVLETTKHRRSKEVAKS